MKVIFFKTGFLLSWPESVSHGFCIFASCVWSLQGLESQTGPFAKGFKNYGQDVLLVLPLLSTHMSLLMLFTGLHLELSGCIFCWSRLMASMALCFCWASWREVVLNLSTAWWLHLFAAGTTPLWLKVRLWPLSRCFLKNSRRASCFS